VFDQSRLMTELKGCFWLACCVCQYTLVQHCLSVCLSDNIVCLSLCLCVCLTTLCVCVSVCLCSTVVGCTWSAANVRRADWAFLYVWQSWGRRLLIWHHHAGNSDQRWALLRVWSRARRFVSASLLKILHNDKAAFTSGQHVARTSNMLPATSNMLTVPGVNAALSTPA